MRYAPPYRFCCFRRQNHSEGDGDYFQPHCRCEGHSVKEHAAKLGDDDLKGEGQCEYRKHGFVAGNVFEDALVVQLSAVESVEELKDDKEGEEHRGHFPFRRAHEVPYVLPQEYCGDEEPVDGDAREHLPRDDVGVASCGFFLHEVAAYGFKSQCERGRPVHDDVEP